MAQIALGQLESHLSKQVLPLYTVWGDEPLLVQESVDAIRAAARKQGHAERSVHTVLGQHFDWSALLASSQTQSLFADKQLVELRIPSGKPGKEGGAALEAFARSAQNDDGCVRIVALPGVDKTTQNTAWFQALQQHGACVEAPPVARTALPRWIAERLARNGQSVSADAGEQHALEFFADCVEGNLLAAHQEVQKLALLHPAGPLSAEQIQRAVLNVARYDVATLSQCVFSGQLVRALRVLEGLRAEGQPEVMVHWTLAEDIRALYRVCHLLAHGKPLPLALQEARVWGLRQRLLERAAPLFSLGEAVRLLKAAQTVDGIVKGLRAPGWPQAPWPALQRLVTLACRQVHKNRPVGK